MNQDYENFKKFLKETIKAQDNKHDLKNLIHIANIKYSCCKHVYN